MHNRTLTIPAFVVAFLCYGLATTFAYSEPITGKLLPVEYLAENGEEGVTIGNGTPESTKPPDKPLTIRELNDLVDSSNFIVNSGCSGTLISVEHGLMLTAHHCVDGFIRWVDKEVVEDGTVKKKKVEVRRPVTVEQKVYAGSTQVGGASYKTEIVGYSDYTNGHDLALLRFMADKIPMDKAVPIIPKGRETVRGERVYVIGNPAGLDASVTQGIIVSTAREYQSKTGNKVQLLQTDAEVFFGNSGGVLMSADGYYLGTVSRGVPGTAVIFAIHYSHIREMLAENCYAELYDSEAQPFAECDAERKAKDEQKDKTVKDLLKELVEANGGG